MLWALHVLDLLLDLDLDLEHLPLLWGLWCLSVLLARDGLLSLPSPWLLCLDLQQLLKCFLVHIYGISYRMLDILSVGVMCCIYYMTYLSCFLFCTHYLSSAWKFLFHPQICNYHCSTIRLVSIEVLYCHFMFFCMVREWLICNIFSLLFGSNPLFNFKMLCSME